MESLELFSGNIFSEVIDTKMLNSYIKPAKTFWPCLIGLGLSPKSQNIGSFKIILTESFRD